MPITHEQYVAEQAASTERYQVLMAEAQAEYQRWWDAQGESTAASDGGPKKKRGRRRKNTPILAHKAKEKCAECKKHPAFAKGVCRSCYMARRRRRGKCACGCGRHAQKDGYALRCYRIRAREVVEAAMGLEPYTGDRCPCGNRIEGTKPGTDEPWKRCTDCRDNMRRAAEHRRVPARRQAA